MTEPETAPAPHPAAPQKQDSPEPRYLRVSLMDRLGVFGAVVVLAGIVIVVPYNQIGSLRSELLATIDLRATKLEAKIDMQTTTLGTSIQVLANLSETGDDNIQQVVAELSATVTKEMAERNDAILTALMGEIGAKHYCTVVMANVPWRLLMSKEWQAVYGKLGPTRLMRFKDIGILEVDFIGLDRPKALAIRDLVELASVPEIKFTIGVAYKSAE